MRLVARMVVVTAVQRADVWVAQREIQRVVLWAENLAVATAGLRVVQSAELTVDK